jgi:hypothetical protein
MHATAVRPAGAGALLRVVPARIVAAASRPVDGASLGVFRLVYGLVGVVSGVRILAHGWVGSLYVGPAHHLTYPGFSWVRPPPLWGGYLLVGVVIVAAAAVALGWRYRIAMVAFWLAFTWIELIDATTYLNHYWAMTLIGLIMVVAPMDAALTRRPERPERPVAAGWVWLLRFQIAVVYVFAGLAKLQADWLVHALPLRLWLPARAGLPVVGPLLAQPLTAHALSWAGALFDCSVVALLLWKRTRLLAWAAVVAFHVTTWILFPIGVFPWLMIGATTVFFDPAWPRRLRLTRTAVRWLSGPRPTPTAMAPTRPLATGTARTVVASIAVVWVAVQLVLPLRHLAYPGDAHWTAEGYRWSWNVLLTEKSGMVTFVVTDPATGRSTTTTASDLLTARQIQMMATDPELIRQTAHLVADDHARRAGAGAPRVEVRAEAYQSLDGRPASRLVDPTVDLAAEPFRIGHQRWVLAEGADPL